MAYKLDTSQSFAITLTAMLEGFGNLAYIEVVNATQDIAVWWAEGSWSGTLGAVEADSIQVYTELKNEGTATDTLFAEFESVPQVNHSEPSLQEMPNIPVGSSPSAEWTFTMPAQNVNITINAGHVE